MQEKFAPHFIVDFSDLSGTSVKADNTGMLKESMHRYSPLFLGDAWEPDNMRDFKNTIVFIEERAFRTFYEMLSDVKLNTWMSVMLLDTENKLIKEEIELKRKKRT